MDQIIWDPQSLQIIQQQLRRASLQLDGCRDELRRAGRQAEELFSENRAQGGTSQRILRQTDSALHRAERAGERATALAAVMVRLQEMIHTTEVSISKLASGGSAPGQNAAGSVSSPFQDETTYFHAGTGVTGITPDWLRSAADTAFAGR